MGIGYVGSVISSVIYLTAAGPCYFLGTVVDLPLDIYQYAASGLAYKHSIFCFDRATAYSYCILFTNHYVQFL